MRITQLDCETLTTFQQDAMRKWSMNRYEDRRLPVVFFGCYNRGPRERIMKHTGLVVIVWAGSDSMNMKNHEYFNQFCRANKHRIFHIAHSHWIRKDLEEVGLEVIDRVILPKDLSAFKYCDNPGKSVYHYTCQDRKRQSFYGTDVVERLITKWGQTKGKPQVHITNFYAMKQEELIHLYEDSYIGVRLTTHDNMSLSCIEMGLMGRPSIFNGNIPGAIPFTDREAIEPLILNGDKKPSKLLAEEMAEFVYDDMKWLNTEYYD